VLVALVLVVLHFILPPVTTVNCETEAFELSYAEYKEENAYCIPPEPGQGSVSCEVTGEVTNPQRYTGNVDPDHCSSPSKASGST
jgi:hypothetical protein